MRKRSNIVPHDMCRATAVLERAAADSGDYFLQYLYGVAILHLEEGAGIRHDADREPSSDDVDPDIAKLAKNLLHKPLTCWIWAVIMSPGVV